MKTKTIGVVRDFSYGERPGVDEVTVDEFTRAVPDGYEVVACPPNGMRNDCAAYISFSLANFGEQEMEFLAEHPRHVHYEQGWWPLHGRNGKWRNPFVENVAQMVFVSPMQLERWEVVYNMKLDTALVIPPPMPQWESLYQGNGTERKGTMWVGFWHPSDGADIVARWAEQNGRHIDAYGVGVPLGQATPWITGKGDVPTYEPYAELVYFPRQPVPFGSQLLHAYERGLTVTYNGEIGCFSFSPDLEGLVETCRKSPEEMWNVVSEVL